MYILAVDGGGSAAKAVVFHEEGTALGWGYGGACNFSVDRNTAAASIEEAGRKALSMAGLRWDQLSRTGVGLSGAGRPQEQRWMEDALSSRTTAVVDHDGMIAVLGGLAGDPGAAVISGTGSIAIGRDRDGQTARAGGWGYILGDEGSSFTIAVEAVGRALKGRDGRLPRDPQLEQAVIRRYKLSSLMDVIAYVYKTPLDRGRIAVLAQDISQLALSGHKEAARILSAAGAQLGQLVTAVLNELALLNEPCRAVYCGGTFQAGRPLLDPLQRAIERRAYRCRVGPPQLPPVAGALFLACPDLQQDSAVVLQLQRSLRGTPFAGTEVVV